MTAPTIIGIDLSLTGTGIADSYGEKTLRTNAADPMEARLILIRNHIAALDGVRYTIGIDQTVVVLEDFVTRSPAASTLGMVHGIVRVALVEAGIPFVLVAPATLKKYVTGKGTAKKPDMRMAVYQRFGVDLSDDNQVDAYGLRAMALDAYGTPMAAMPVAQRECLDKIVWPTIGERAA